MKKLMTLILATCFLSVVQPAIAQDTIYGGFVPGADLFIFLDLEAFSNAPVSRKLDDIIHSIQPEDQNNFYDQLTEGMGLEKEDVLGIVLSVDLDSINFTRPESSQFGSLPGVLAVGVRKAIQLENVKAGIDLFLEQNDAGDQVRTTLEARDGTPVLAVGPADGEPVEEGPKEILCMMSEDNQTVLFSFNTSSLLAAKSRVADRTLSSPSPEMAEAFRGMKGKPVRFVFLFPDQMKEQLQTVPRTNPMMGSMASMQAALFSASADDSFQMNLKLDMATVPAATQAAVKIQQMIPMVMSSSGTDPLFKTIMENLAVFPEGTYVSFSTRITLEEIEGLEPQFLKAREQVAKNACVNNLRMIEGTKDQYAIENNLATGDSAPESELFGPDKFLRERPVCPEGGTYTINVVGTDAACTIEGHSLSW